MTVHDKIGTFRHSGRAKLTTWIFEIAKNRAIDYHRAAVAEVELDTDLADPLPDDTVVYAGRNRDLLEWLKQELQMLSEEDQALLKWRAFEIPYAQIAEWLGIAEGTARVRHKRAMEKLLSKGATLTSRKGAARP